MSGTDIHPTAIVDPGARLGDGVRIGPYCVIGANVELGDGCRLQHHVTLEGPSIIGAGNVFYAYASIGQQTPGSEIPRRADPPARSATATPSGNSSPFTAAPRRSPARASATGGNFLAYSHVAHDCVVGDGVIFSNNGTLAGHVRSRISR